MYNDVVQWTDIRKMVLMQGIPIRKIAMKTGISRNTIKKISKHKLPPGYRREKKILYPRLGPHREYIKILLHQRESIPSPVKLTFQRIYEKLRDERSYAGSYSTVRTFISKNRHTSQIGCISQNILGDIYDQIISLSRSDAIKYLLFLSRADPPVILQKKVKNFLRTFAKISSEKQNTDNKTLKGQAAYDWMHSVLQGQLSRGHIARDIGEIVGAERLLTQLYEDRLPMRNRALCVLAEAKGIEKKTIFAFLGINKATGYKYLRNFKSGGIDLLNHRKRKVPLQVDNEKIKKAVFATLHEPPSSHGINRTTWKSDDFISVLATKGIVVGRNVVRQITRKAGFKWRKARVVLTSKDPKYREKLNRVQNVLQNLGGDEAFFSIDEFGPFAVKKKGGRKLVDQKENFTVPQWQKSKGWLIMTAALELSSNQVTHFYSEKKNTVEMIKMMDILLKEYRGYRKIWLSWDAASWRMSKKLFEEIDAANIKAKVTESPMVEALPLPAGAQFLNVIESVFSGLARGVIHNSDYMSVNEAKSAINRYFEDRNIQYQRNPKRAGKKIWGEERVPSKFHEANNCKDPRYR